MLAIPVNSKQTVKLHDRDILNMYLQVPILYVLIVIVVFICVLDVRNAPIHVSIQ